jgi:hypothetical protein
MKPSHKLRSFLLGSSLLAVATTAHAANRYWSGDVNGNWNTGSGANTNWSSTLGSNTNVTALPGSGDVAIFTMTGAGNLTTSLGQAFALQGLEFNSASAVTINTTTANTLEPVPDFASS